MDTGTKTDPLAGLMTTAQAAKEIGVKPDTLLRAITGFPQYAPVKLGGQFIWTRKQADAACVVAVRISSRLCPHCGNDPAPYRNVKPAKDAAPKPDDNGGTE